MEICSEREEFRTVRIQGFRQGVGFQPSSVDVDLSMEMTLEFDDKDDEPEDLEDEDLDAEDTLPRRRATNR
jgi:hypothetical protein